VELAESERAAAFGGSLQLGTPGEHNADNALAAALASLAAGLPAAAVVRGLAQFGGVEGRFQVLSESPLCIIDFAHTPDALERALRSARGLLGARPSAGRLAVVFGCGGERDQAKRPAMGAVADQLADAVWLTTDNARSEEPAAIARAVRGGAAGQARWHEVPERATAIAQAIAQARPQDAVLVAGRGHERVQHLAAGPVASRDLELVRAALVARRA
jgi:UDP-N-acetylmuramoyl-L-alanyl-D-glutamate--2,6-diaminopimelate ligase